MKQKQYIYKLQLVRPEVLSRGPTPGEAEILQQHADYVAELTRQSTVLVAGRTQTTEPDAFGIVIFCAQNDSEAASIMENDPAVQGGVMTADLYPYNIAFLADNIHEHYSHKHYDHEHHDADE